MLDPNFIRANTEKVRQNTLERNMNAALVDDWLTVDHERATTLASLEEINRSQNQLADSVKAGADVNQVREKGKELKEQQRVLQEKYDAVNHTWMELINQIPNIHLPEVPIAATEDGNVVLRQVGDIPNFEFPIKDHLQLATELDILDFEAGAKVAGSQFYFTKNELVQLEFALMMWGLQELTAKGFTPFTTPDMAKSRFYLGTGYAPRGDEAQIYEIDDEDLGLIATAEVTMAALHADEILELEQPKKYVAISHCYRKESGAYGKFSKGLYRVHQFTKLEMFVYCKAEDSARLHAELLQIEEELVQKLGIPYQVLEMCSGDLGAMAARKYDLEAWMPGRNAYGEITSTSNTTDFQARNLNIRYRNADGKTEFAHLLNGTAIVSSRIPVAILENFQQADGSVEIPEVLHKFTGFTHIKPKV